MVDPKRVTEVLDYTFDFAPKTNGAINSGKDYLESGETLLTKVVTVTGATKDSDEFVNTNTGVKFWLSAGTAETEAVALCVCTTSNGRTVVRDMVIKIEPDSCN